MRFRLIVDARRPLILAAAAGTEPVESEELPPGRSIFSMMATLAPPSWAAIAAAMPQAPAPTTRTSISDGIARLRVSAPESGASAPSNSAVSDTSAYFSAMSNRLTACEVALRS